MVMKNGFRLWATMEWMFVANRNEIARKYEMEKVFRMDFALQQNTYWAMFCSRPYWIAIGGCKLRIISNILRNWWIRHLNESWDMNEIRNKELFCSFFSYYIRKWFEANLIWLLFLIGFILRILLHQMTHHKSAGIQLRILLQLDNNANLQNYYLLFIYSPRCIHRLQLTATTNNIIEQQTFILTAAKQQPCQVNILHLH